MKKGAKKKMKLVRKRFYCRGCNQEFEQLVLETVVTTTCPNCKPLVYLLEFVGLTPKQALVLMVCVVGVGYLSRK